MKVKNDASSLIKKRKFRSFKIDEFILNEPTVIGINNNNNNNTTGNGWTSKSKPRSSSLSSLSSLTASSSSSSLAAPSSTSRSCSITSCCSSSSTSNRFSSSSPFLMTTSSSNLFHNSQNEYIIKSNLKLFENEKDHQQVLASNEADKARLKSSRSSSKKNTRSASKLVLERKRRRTNSRPIEPNNNTANSKHARNRRLNLKNRRRTDNSKCHWSYRHLPVYLKLKRGNFSFKAKLKATSHKCTFLFPRRPNCHLNYELAANTTTRSTKLSNAPEQSILTTTVHFNQPPKAPNDLNHNNNNNSPKSTSTHINPDLAKNNSNSATQPKSTFHYASSLSSSLKQKYLTDANRSVSYSFVPQKSTASTDLTHLLTSFDSIQQITATSTNNRKTLGHSKPISSQSGKHVNNTTTSRADRALAQYPNHNTSSQKLKSLTNILLFLKLNHNVNAINRQIRQLHSTDQLNLNEIKQLLKRYLSAQLKLILNQDSDMINNRGGTGDNKKQTPLSTSTSNNNNNNNNSNNNRASNRMTILNEDSPAGLLHKSLGGLFSQRNEEALMDKKMLPGNDYMYENNSDTTKSLAAITDYSNKQSFLSEPPNVKCEYKHDDTDICYFDEERHMFNAFLIEKSPTLKHLYSSLIRQQSQSIQSNLNRSSSSSECVLASSLDDMLNVYNCAQLVLKRSFSASKLKLKQKYVKKSTSFEKFLENVINGKKKSTTFKNNTTNGARKHFPANTLHVLAPDLGQICLSVNEPPTTAMLADRKSSEKINSSLRSINSVSLKDDVSSSSSECQAATHNATHESAHMNPAHRPSTNVTVSHHNWPVLKIDDSTAPVRGPDMGDLQHTVTNLVDNLSRLADVSSSRQNEPVKSTNINNQELSLTDNSSYIPTSVREALEIAGINIDEIINMKNQLEMSFAAAAAAGVVADNGKNPTKVTTTTTTTTTKTTTGPLVESSDQSTKKTITTTTTTTTTGTGNGDSPSIENQLEALIDNMKSVEIINRFNAEVSISNLKSLEIKQNLCAKVTQNVENVAKVALQTCAENEHDQESKTKNINRKKSSATSRYATVSNFPTAPDDGDAKAKNLTAPTQGRMTLSPSWNFDVSTTNDSSSNAKLGGKSATSAGSMLDGRIIPFKKVAQFKPQVNVHKRTSTRPMANLNQLISSTSTDSFLNMISYSSSESPPPQLQTAATQPVASPSSATVVKSTEQPTNDDTQPQTPPATDQTKSLPNRNKKKVNVSRSFSYNIGKIFESGSRKLAVEKPQSTSETQKQQQKSEVSVGRVDSLDKSDDSSAICVKNKKSLPSIMTDGASAAVKTTPTNISTPAMINSKSASGLINKPDKPAVTKLAETATTTTTTTTLPKLPLVATSSDTIKKISNDTTNNQLQMSAPILQTAVSSAYLKFPSSLVDDSTSKDNTKRKAIIVQMYDTEKSYVEALKILVTKYYLPLKEKDIVERNLINDIFYKIPEIHVHHELLLTSLKTKLDVWDTKQTVGDVLLSIFAKISVIETYISFVNNYRTSQEAFRICKEQSSLFSKFVEQQAKDHRGKLTLKDLIIQPVQRIPRYELYIKDFLKCTPTNHPDYQLLLKAQKEVHNLAEKIDQVHKEVNETYALDSQSVLQTIQDLVENLDDLVTAYRYYIRHDMVTVTSSTGMKKDRCMFLFSDLLILTSYKRRSANINKKSNSIILNSPIGKQYLENSKHKLVMKFHLEDIDLTGVNLFKKLSLDKDYLEEDLNTITRINELVKNIVYPHQNLDESLKEITANILRHLNETSISSSMPFSPPTVQSTNINNSTTNNGPSSQTTTSSTSAMNTATAPGTAINPVQTETNDGKQNQLVLCINTTERIETMTVVFSNIDHKHSWEKCFIDAKKVFFESFSRKPATFLNTIPIPKNRSGVQFTCASARLYLANDQNDVWICTTDGQMGQVCIMNTIPELAISSCNTVCSSRISCIQCVPPFHMKRGSICKKSNRTKSFSQSTDTTNEFRSDSQIQIAESQMPPITKQESIIDYDSSDDDKDSQSDKEEEKDNQTITTSSQTLQINLPDTSCIPTLNTNSYQEIKHSTMWIGNDDGSLHVFQFNDSTVRTVARKNRITKQFSAGIQSLAYMDNRVFVSLKNGDMVLFRRIYSIWNYDSYTIKSVAPSSFNCMINVAGKLWCTCNNTIRVLNPCSLDCEHTYSVDGEKSLHLAAGGNCTWAVWIACLNNLDLKLYHATKHIILAELNIKQCISQKLTGVDEIIRIHKTSCLKITCLYVCKDTLWVGTSAGVIVNVKIPYINNATSKLNNPISYSVLNYGHTGPVRFITSVDIPKQSSLQTNDNTTVRELTKNQLRTVVISGGEGYDEYRPLSTVTSGTSLSNIGVSNSNSNANANQNDAQNLSNSPLSGTNVITSGSPSNSMNMANMSASMSSNLDENNLGKEDLVNYVLTWEL